PHPLLPFPTRRSSDLLHRSGISRAQIHEAVAHGPAMARVDSLVLEDIASRAVSFETRKSSGASFISGIPGGFAVLGTIPFDIAQDRKSTRLNSSHVKI